MAKRKPTKLRILEKKLGRSDFADGQYWESKNLIEIDPRQSPRQYLATLVHELVHAAMPELSEKEVIRVSFLISRYLWEQKYRKVNQ